MEFFLDLMEQTAEIVLSTPFAIPAAVLAFVGGLWVLAEAFTKAQENA